MITEAVKLSPTEIFKFSHDIIPLLSRIKLVFLLKKQVLTNFACCNTGAS